MKAFVLRNQRAKLKISDQKSQFNKENALAESQAPNFSIIPLPKVTRILDHYSSTTPQKIETSKKVTFYRATEAQEEEGSPISGSISKLEKRNLSSNEVNKPKRAQTRVFSATKIQKSQSFHDIKIPTVKTLKDIEERNNMRDLIEELIVILKKQYIVQQNHIKFYTIKKYHFEELLNYLVQFITLPLSDKNDSVHLKYPHFHFLKICLTKLGQIIKEESMKQKIGRLSLSSNSISFTYNHMMHQSEVSHQRSQLLTLLKNKEEIKRTISQHEEKDNFYKKEMEENLKIIREQIQEKEKLTQIVMSLEEKIHQLHMDIEQNTQCLKQVKQTEEKIKNFVNEQSNRMIKMASEDYKRIESDIYEYAVYLQSNQLASDLNYEPAPYKVIEEKVMEQMKNVNKTLIQETQIDIQVKSRMMRDFVVLSMEKFKRKDTQLLKLLEFKTKCIRKFVNNMQMWLDNWTLKQEYLVNLRNEFLVDTNKLTENIKILKSIEYCHTCRAKQGHLLDSVADLYHKIELNYKMGNSFY